jgi:hypothetical protein
VAVVDDVDGDAGFLEPPAQVGGETKVILDDEHTHCLLTMPFGR